MLSSERDLLKILKNRPPVIHFDYLKKRLSMIHPFRIAKMLVKLMRDDKVVIGTTGGKWHVIVRYKGDMFDGIQYEVKDVYD